MPVRRCRGWRVAPRAACWGGGDGEAGLAPLGKPVFQAARSQPSGTKGRDGFGGEEAQGPPAVGDNLEAGVELAEAGLQVLQRQRDRPGDVPGCVLLGRADVEDDDLTGPDALEQLGTGHPLGAVAARPDGAKDLVDLRQACPAEVAERGDEAAHLLAGGAVVDAGPLPAGLDQAGLANHLQVRRRRRELEPRRLGQGLDAALGLAEQVEQLDALGVHDYLADARQLLVDIGASGIMFHKSME